MMDPPPQHTTTHLSPIKRLCPSKSRLHLQSIRKTRRQALDRKPENSTKPKHQFPKTIPSLTRDISPVRPHPTIAISPGLFPGSRNKSPPAVMKARPPDALQATGPVELHGTRDSLNTSVGEHPKHAVGKHHITA